MAEPHEHVQDPAEPADASAGSRLQRALLRWFPPHRVADAVRAAIAAMAAWLVGNLLPGDLAQYAYAAALGAFVATGTSFFSIARTALQQAVALAIGAALGLALTNVDLPGLVAIGIVAAVAVLLPGATALGTSASVVPVAALLVLMFGDIDPDGYAIAYVGQFSVGLVVGVLVNALARPPLYDRRARHRIHLAVRSLADRVDALAEMLRGDWPPERSDWADWAPELEAWTADLDEDMRQARESRRLNPRTLWRPHDVGRDRDDLAAVHAIVHRMVDVLDTASGAAWSTPVAVALDRDERRLTADALDATAAHLRSWSAQRGVVEASDASAAAIDALYARVTERTRPESGASALIFALRAMRERIDRVATREDG